MSAIKIDIALAFRGEDFRVRGNYYPARPAPPSFGDHDHPNFSDPGDPEGFELWDLTGEDRRDIADEITDEEYLDILEHVREKLAEREECDLRESE